MDSKQAAARFGALAQKTRLDVIRRLVKAGPNGVYAGKLATELSIAASTLSFHLKELSHNGLVSAEREGRLVRYRADYDGIQSLIRFLMEDCCENDPTICDPLLPPTGK